MPDRRQERRALFEAILADHHASHGERLKADEALRELELEERRVMAVDRLSPEEALREAESLADAMPGVLVMARVAAGADAMDVVAPPVVETELLEVIELQEEVIVKLERRLTERERALQLEHRHRLLPPAPEFRL